MIEQRPDAPDMVYAMNLGLPIASATGDRVVMSHMRYPQRRGESVGAAVVRSAAASRPRYVGRDGIGAHFEAGDAFAFGGRLVVGYGPRTEELALKHLATDLEVRVAGVRITHPGMYHLDLAFCPLDERRRDRLPGAFDEAERADPARPGARAAGAHRGGGDDVLRQLDRRRPHRDHAGLPDRGCARSSRRGASRSCSSTSSEFHKGGGSIRCLTNPLDVTIGRDLARSPAVASSVDAGRQPGSEPH